MTPARPKLLILSFFDISQSENEGRKTEERRFLNPVLQSSEKKYHRFTVYTFASRTNEIDHFSGETPAKQVIKTLEDAVVHSQSAEKGTNLGPVFDEVYRVCTQVAEPGENVEVLIFTNGGINDYPAAQQEVGRLKGLANLQDVMVGPLTMEPSGNAEKTSCYQQMGKLLVPLGDSRSYYYNQEEQDCDTAVNRMVTDLRKKRN